MDLVNMVDSDPRNLSLVIEGKRLPKNERDPAWPPAKYGPDILLDAGFLMDHRDERMASLALEEFISTRTPKRPNPGLESLVLRGIDIRIWQKGNLSHALNLRNLKRLALVNCNNPMLISWTRYPQDMESLEIVNPDQTYPYKAGLVLTDNLLAKPLSHFCHLSELNLQHIGGPICEVLFQLGLDAGKQLKVLKLHDQEVTGIDEIYSFQRDGSDALDCPMYKLLVYICPNLEVLSLDISSNAVDSKSMGRHYRSSDSRSVALEPLLEQVNNVSTLPVFETLRSLQCLRSLRLVTADVGNARSEQVSDRIGRSTCSADIEYFTLAVSASRSTEDIGNVEDVFRLDPNGASHLVRRPDIWHTVPRAIWYG